MRDISRRQFAIGAPTLLGGAAVLSACTTSEPSEDYETLSSQIWQPAPAANSSGLALRKELVRCATLAPSSHNTQCWKFEISEQAITIIPDLSRRCPAVDPDDHHLYISLGCACENLASAALAHGLHADTSYDPAQDAVRVSLEPTRPQISPLFAAIPWRQCTRNDYDGSSLSAAELALLERAGSAPGVSILLITERHVLDQMLEQIVAANTAQMADAAFIKELKSWIRFNGSQAARTRDGLFTLTTGNPTIPTWVGDIGFEWFFKPKSENDKIARQIRSSAGLAVFVGQKADKASWVEVGRSYERFALQATALGIRNAMLNQPVEVQALRPQFAASLGLGAQRPDLVVRFGRGPAMPRSLRRPVEAVES
jgi:hypothetical protein